MQTEQLRKNFIDSLLRDEVKAAKDSMDSAKARMLVQLHTDSPTVPSKVIERVLPEHSNLVSSEQVDALRLQFAQEQHGRIQKYVNLKKEVTALQTSMTGIETSLNALEAT